MMWVINETGIYRITHMGPVVTAWEQVAIDLNGIDLTTVDRSKIVERINEAYFPDIEKE
jgi:hypothetical protein